MSALLVRSPGRWLRALRLAWNTRPPGPAALFRQLAYFAEAGIVAERMRERGLVHLHNHFASSSGTVAMLAAELGGFTFSISEHGPDIFYAPEWWRLDAKFSRALFVACISHFCRSQVLIWTPLDRWHRVPHRALRRRSRFESAAHPSRHGAGVSSSPDGSRR